MAYKDMFTVLVVDSRIRRSRSLNDAFERILGYLRDVHHLRTDLIGTTEDAIIRLRNDASVACVLLEWGGKGAGIDGGVSWTPWPTSASRPRCSSWCPPMILCAIRRGC